MNDEYEIKKTISRLSSRLYGDIRVICSSEGITQLKLDELVQSVTIDRIVLALSFYECAKKIGSQLYKQDGDYRSIISRCYYCHYHLARALIFLITKDDVDNHEKLPKKLSDCLKSDYALFIDRLDRYRRIRNEVDYSPYPEINDSLDAVALQIIQETEESIKLILQCFKERGIMIDASI
jgi:uncharacterized protein (UPF0332 family)